MEISLDLFAALSDAALLDEVSRLAGQERGATAALIASLAEVDLRRLYLGQGYSSMFTFCTGPLHLSEHAAYHRIHAARAVRRFPSILERLEQGRLTLSSVVLLAPHLTVENWERVLDAAAHQSKRSVEQLVARLQPQPDVPQSLRRLPRPRHSPTTQDPVLLEDGSSEAKPLEPAELTIDHHTGVPGAARPRAETTTADRAPLALGGSAGCGAQPVAGIGDYLQASPTTAPGLTILRPLAPARYQLQVTVSEETHAKLRRAQELLRHALPDGDLAQVVDRALTMLLRHLETAKCGAPHSGARAKAGSALPRPGLPEGTGPTAGAAGRTPNRRMRYITAAVRREVWRRDGGQCAFVGDAGRCPERAFLEYHHLVPFAEGGGATVENVSLRCARHNRHEAEEYFGAEVVAGAVASVQATEGRATQRRPRSRHVTAPPLATSG